MILIMYLLSVFQQALNKQHSDYNSGIDFKTGTQVNFTQFRLNIISKFDHNSKVKSACKRVR
jgi:hypothetical protein